ncbi:hypothetical protein [Acidocella facilis]|uniref:hypothetical protein n=1 Tax=Acidocella facilis TaxID=525 RepID=UPI001F2871F9|nr:hypothetical protein [Acidocella facilis]
MLIENRKGLVGESTLTPATGTAERAATLTMQGRRTGNRRITLGPIKPTMLPISSVNCACKVTPHIAVDGSVYKTGTRHKSAFDGRTTRHPGYEISLQCRRRLEEVFGWAKVSAGLSKFKLK